MIIELHTPTWREIAGRQAGDGMNDMNWGSWLQGLISALANSAYIFVAALLVLDQPPPTWKLFIIAGGPALISFFSYLKQTPPPFGKRSGSAAKMIVPALFIPLILMGCAGTGALTATTPEQANVIEQTVTGLNNIDKMLTSAGRDLATQWGRSWRFQGKVVRKWIEIRLWDAPAPAIVEMAFLDEVVLGAVNRKLKSLQKTHPDATILDVRSDTLTFSDEELGSIFASKTVLTASNMMAIINRIAPAAGQALRVIFGGSLM